MKRRKTAKKAQTATPKAKSVRRKPAPANSVRIKKPARTKKSARITSKGTGTLDAMLTAAAEALKLTIDPAWHGSVKFNLELILRHGALVDGFVLPDDTEPGPVFHA